MENDFYALLMVLFFAALFHAGWKACQEADRNEGQHGYPKKWEDNELTFRHDHGNRAGVFAIATVYTGGRENGEKKNIPQRVEDTPPNFNISTQTTL